MTSPHGQPFTLDLKGCARCGGDGHSGITFQPLTYPVEYDDGSRWTHWAPCPTSGEPIILLITERGE